MCDELVERPDNLSAELAASYCGKEAYRSELVVVNEDLAKTSVGRANLRWIVNNLGL